MRRRRVESAEARGQRQSASQSQAWHEQGTAAAPEASAAVAALLKVQSRGFRPASGRAKQATPVLVVSDLGVSLPELRGCGLVDALANTRPVVVVTFEPHTTAASTPGCEDAAAIVTGIAAHCTDIVTDLDWPRLQLLGIGFGSVVVRLMLAMLGQREIDRLVLVSPPVLSLPTLAVKTKVKMAPTPFKPRFGQTVRLLRQLRDSQPTSSADSAQSTRLLGEALRAMVPDRWADEHPKRFAETVNLRQSQGLRNLSVLMDAYAEFVAQPPAHCAALLGPGDTGHQTLLLVGQDDALLEQDNVAAAQALNDASVLCTLPGVGHHFWVCDTQRYGIQTICDFVSLYTKDVRGPEGPGLLTLWPVAVVMLIGAISAWFAFVEFGLRISLRS
eukprot:m.192789 g.192789  ORF g.192789 m.192789 type:complete len:388 (-) comp18275_c0_seq1:282-1445(-)